MSTVRVRLTEIRSLASRLMQIVLIGSCMFACSSGSSDVATLLGGHFSSMAQSKADSEYFDVRLHMVRIWPSRSDAIWMYVEQAMESAPCKPYRQRIYRVTEPVPGEVVSQVFEMRDADAFICAWAAPERFDVLEPTMLTEREGCRITLRKINGVWCGSTDGQSCLSSLRGATYATSEVRLERQRIETWDRGFDAQGKQVWGARKGAYIFERLGETPVNPCANPSVATSARQ